MKVSRRVLVGVAAIVGLVGLLVALALLAVRQRPDTAVYVGLMVAAVGFVAALVFDRARILRLARGRQVRYGTNAALAVGALLSILILVNIVAFQNPQSWDLTEDRRYSLAPETVEILKTTQDDVRLIGFYTADQDAGAAYLRPLLEQYREAGGGRVTYEFIDPRQNPLRAEEYGVTEDSSLVVALGGASEVAGAPSEQEITESILRLTHPGSRKVYFLTGHGERDVEASDDSGYSQLRQALEAKNYTVEMLRLLITPQVPDDALAVVVAGPTAPLSATETQAIQSYLEQGGGLVALIDPAPGTRITAENDTLSHFLRSTWGLDPQPDLVVDLSSSMPLAAISARYDPHPITDRMQNLLTYFPTARSFVLDESSAGEPTRTALVLTGSNSWSETALEGLTQESQIEFSEAEDMPGPLTVAAAAESLDGLARIVAIGDSDFGANADFPAYGNGDLLVNSVDWAAGQDELISLTPKQTIERFVATPSRQTLVIVALVSILLVPASFLALGVSTWWGRRSRA